MNVHPWFFTREKVETERTISKDRRAHACNILHEAPRLFPGGLTAQRSAASRANILLRI
jgi:hypothetical protein